VLRIALVHVVEVDEVTEDLVARARAEQRERQQDAAH
jgi:hypothetical protein